MVVNWNERQGSGPEGDKVLKNSGGLSFVRPFVCPSIRPPPQALSDLKSALSDLKFTLSDLESALSGFESERANFWPERADFRSERAWGGRTDKQKSEWPY